MMKQATDMPDQAQQAALAEAEAAFDKLPMLGPVAWLYGRTQDRRFLFLNDLDWAVMPPVVLDQCRLFMRGKMPFAFMTWAFVSEEVHQRLMQGQGKLAPHEWKSGQHAWLIDVVTPFGGQPEMLAELMTLKFADYCAVNYLEWDALTQKLTAKQLAPVKKDVPMPAPASGPLH